MGCSRVSSPQERGVTTPGNRDEQKHVAEANNYGVAPPAGVSSSSSKPAKYSVEEVAYEPLAKAGLDKFPRSFQALDGSRLAEALRMQCLAVVKASYFIDCLNREEPFADRAQIPKEMMFSGSETVEQWKKHGYTFLVVVSYGWLTVDHPDPDLFHLRSLVHILRELQASHYSNPFTRQMAASEIGVIIDFCSLWQTPGSQETRGRRQMEEFREGMQCMADAYGHEDVTAIMLTTLPRSERRLFTDRGWTLMESTLADSKVPSKRTENGERNVFSFGAEFDPKRDQHRGAYFGRTYAKCSRWPPMPPDCFNQRLEERSRAAESKNVSLFSDSQDRAVVCDQYQRAFEVFAQRENLDYNRMGFRDAAGVEELARVLPECKRLTSLTLSENEVTRLPLGIFGSLEKLQALSLSKNEIFELEPGIFSGLRSLQSIDLSGNALQQLELGLFADLGVLKSLRLSSNALEVLQPGVFDGLSQLQTLGLDDNKLTSLTPGVFGGLGSLTHLALVRNALTDPNKWKVEALRASSSCKVQVNEG